MSKDALIGILIFLGLVIAALWTAGKGRRKP
jgi:hypothetical protein